MPIQILPARLANQIAAGEVVERPASVIKELVENALDADASRIDIEVEKGGKKLIRIRDNGCGIPKEELTLALSRHATSKVTSIDDLEQISSLGFRGEALASISSVSRLKLTSCPAEQPEAWQAYAEGRDMAVQIVPAAHPQGTSIEVVDLFFNMPARRKFLRTEKTEFHHIDELIKRIALSRFDLVLHLVHNGKIVRRYPKAHDVPSRKRRLVQICGNRFVDNSLEISCQLDEVKLYGWIILPQACKMQVDIQYTYVNGRMIRDKLINHAIRQAYGRFIDDQFHASYVLFLTIDAQQIDINVHPAKHEIRFHQARLIHDFLVQSIVQGIEEGMLNGQVSLDVEQDEKHDGDGAQTWLQPEWSEHPTAQEQLNVETSTIEGVNSNVTSYPSAQISLRVKENSDTRDNMTSRDKLKAFAYPNFSGKNEVLIADDKATQHPTKLDLSVYRETLGAFCQSAVDIKPSINATKMDQLSPNLSQTFSMSSEKIVSTNQDDKCQNIDVSLQSFCLSVISGYFALYQYQNRLFLLDLAQVSVKVASLQYTQGLIGQPLLLPVKINYSQLDNLVEQNWLTERLPWFSDIGIHYQCSAKAVIVKKVPSVLRHCDVCGEVGKLFCRVRQEEQQASLENAVSLTVAKGVEFLYEQCQTDKEWDLFSANQCIMQALEMIALQELLTCCAIEVDLTEYIGNLRP